MVIEKKFTESKNYGDKRNKDDIEYIVVQEFSDKPTAHYHIVGEKAVQLIPDDYISNAVNGGRYCHLGVYHGICTKFNSISICISENPTDDDLKLLSHVIMTLKRRYKVDLTKIIRQADVTGEPNPQIFLDSSKWHDRVIQKIIDME